MNIQNLQELETSAYKCSDFARKVGVMQATVAYHCKLAKNEYYKGDYTKPAHPNYVELQNYGLWFGVSRATYILPLSDHNLRFYSSNNQKKRLESRRKGKKSTLKAPRKQGERRAYVKRKGL